jgi:hypothetical protein
MFQVVKIQKVKRLSSGADTTKPTRDGELSTLTEQRRDQPRDFPETSVSTSTDHSTSDQE